jgi:hypothetical protein
MAELGAVGGGVAIILVALIREVLRLRDRVTRLEDRQPPPPT